MCQFLLMRREHQSDTRDIGRARYHHDYRGHSAAEYEARDPPVAVVGGEVEGWGGDDADAEENEGSYTEHAQDHGAPVAAVVYDEIIE